MRNRLPRHLVVGSIVVLSSSCGLGTDGTPRLIADEDQRPLVEVTT
ncbi:MAG: hypothetical protein ACO32E_06025 [Ilumatobacteraceae bacterium]